MERSGSPPAAAVAAALGDRSGTFRNDGTIRSVPAHGLEAGAAYFNPYPSTGVAVLDAEPCRLPHRDRVRPEGLGPLACLIHAHDRLPEVSSVSRGGAANCARIVQSHGRLRPG